MDSHSHVPLLHKIWHNHVCTGVTHLNCELFKLCKLQNLTKPLQLSNTIVICYQLKPPNHRRERTYTLSFPKLLSLYQRHYFSFSFLIEYNSSIHSSIFGSTMNLWSFGSIIIIQLKLSNSNFIRSFLLPIGIV